MVSVPQTVPFSLDYEGFSLGPFIDDDQCFGDSYLNISQGLSGQTINKSSRPDISDDAINFVLPSTSANNNSSDLNSLSQSVTSNIEEQIILASSPGDLAASLYTSDQSYSSPTIPETPSDLNHPLYTTSFNTQTYMNNLNPTAVPDLIQPAITTTASTLDPIGTTSALRVPTQEELALIQSHLSPELIFYLFDEVQLKELQQKLAPYVQDTQLHARVRRQISIFFQQAYDQQPQDTNIMNLDDPINLMNNLGADSTSSSSIINSTEDVNFLVNSVDNFSPSNTSIQLMSDSDTLISDNLNESSIAPSPDSSDSSLMFRSGSAGLDDKKSTVSASGKPVRKQSESRISLPELYQRMGLGHDHDTARSREQRILGILRAEGFQLGERTWIRDTSEKERRRMIDEIHRQTFADYQYSKELIEVIVRRGSYYLMQGRLRRIRRGRKVEQTHSQVDDVSVYATPRQQVEILPQPEKQIQLPSIPSTPSHN